MIRRNRSEKIKQVDKICCCVLLTSIFFFRKRTVSFQTLDVIMFLIPVNKSNLFVRMGAKGKCIKLLAFTLMAEVMDGIFRKGSTV